MVMLKNSTLTSLEYFITSHLILQYLLDLESGRIQYSLLYFEILLDLLRDCFEVSVCYRKI